MFIGNKFVCSFDLVGVGSLIFDPGGLFNITSNAMKTPSLPTKSPALNNMFKVCFLQTLAYCPCSI